MKPASSLVYDHLIYTSDLSAVLWHQIIKRVRSTNLPQAVVGFHSLVGIAAASTDSIGDIMIYSDAIAHISGLYATSTYLGD